jgi:DNA modification methylase
MPDADFYKFLFDFYRNMIAALKDGGAFYIFHADSEGYNFRKALRDNGITIRQCLIWVKNSLVLGRQDYQWRHEPILYGWKPGAAHYFTNDRSLTTVIDDKIDLKKLKKEELLQMLTEILSDSTPSTVIYHDRPMANDLHPTMKPVTLLGYLIQNSSRRAEIVLDPFIGSGSTMVAAHQLNRRCYAMEIDPEYCEIIIDRMRKFDPELKITRVGKEYGGSSTREEKVPKSSPEFVDFEEVHESSQQQ